MNDAFKDQQIGLIKASYGLPMTEAQFFGDNYELRKAGEVEAGPLPIEKAARQATYESLAKVAPPAVMAGKPHDEGREAAFQAIRKAYQSPKDLAKMFA